MSDLETLIQNKSADEMTTEQLTIAQSEGLETTAWQPGSVIRTIIAIMAQMFAMFSDLIIEPIRGGFGDLLSSLAWAKLWAKQQFDVDHIDAEAATGEITITNPTATAYNHPAGDLIIAHATTGKLYRNSAAVSIPAITTVPNVPIIAVEVGTGSNAAPGSVSVLVGPSMDGVTVTNPEAVLGSDDETITALVTRSREKMAALSPDGPKDAFNYVAKTPELSPTGTPITRASTFADPLTGAITVYCATAAGAPTGPDIAIVQAGIYEWAEPWCMSSTAVAATEVVVPVTYEVWIKSSLTSAQVQTAIADALAEYFSEIKIGGTVISGTIGYVYVDALMVTIAKTTLNDEPIGIVRAQVSVPSADVVFAQGQVAVLGTVTPTINFI